MAVLLAQLPGPINLRLVLSDLKFADILHDLVTAKGNRSGVPRVLAVDRNETRELAGTLHIEAPGTPGYSSYTDNIIPAMTAATAPSGVASSSGSLDIYYAVWRAFDHSLAEGQGWVGINPAGVDWLQYQFPAARIVTRYALTSRSPSGGGIGPPKTWTFKGSNDGSTWVTLDTQTNVTDWATSPNVRKVFDTPNTTAYAYYRLDITAPNGVDYVGVGELEMMETMISGYSSGKDDAIAQIRAINALVTVGTTLTLKSTGATDAVTLKVLPSRGVSQPLDELFELPGGPVLASCAFSFTCEPYAYGPLVTLLNEIVVAPCIVDLGTVPGDYPAPLNMQFLTNSTGFHAVYCGLQRPGSADNLGNYLREAEGHAWTGGNTGISAAATAHGGQVVYNQSTDYAVGNGFDDVSPGSYMLLSRLYMQDPADAGYVKAPIAGQFAYPNIPYFDLYELGCAHLPAKRVLAGEASTHTVMMSSSSGEWAHPVVMDYEAFVPTSWGYFRWHPPGDRTLYAVKLNVNGDGGLYEGDIGNLANFRGGPISCVGPSQLVVFAEDRQQAPGCMLNLSVEVTPRYALWA